MHSTMGVPEKWQAYDCSDYFQSPLAELGWWDQRGQCWYIETAGGVCEDVARGFLVIGRPGVDGIEWGYRRGHQGIWAYYPVEDAFVLIARSADALREGYDSGRITV